MASTPRRAGPKPADVGSQVHELGLRAKHGTKLGLNDGKVRAVTHVNFVSESLEIEPRRAGVGAHHAVRFAEQCLDVRHGLSCLGGDITCMHGLVTDDAGGAVRYEQYWRSRRLVPNAGTRKRRLRPVLRRIVIGARLPGIFD